MEVAKLGPYSYAGTIILCISLLLRWGQTSPIPSLEEPRSVSGASRQVDLSLLGQDDNVDAQVLLGQFLYMLNLTEQGAAPRPRAARVEPPEYMLELYNQYAKDRSTMPEANIARSFKNEDSSPHGVTSRGVRTYPLMFNVSVPHQERIIAAELRLYMLVNRDPGRYEGVDWKVTVFEMQGEGASPLGGVGGEGGKSENGLIGMQELAVRNGHRKHSGWEVFVLTDAAQRWRKSEGTSHWLELHVESLNNDANEGHLWDKDDGDGVGLIGLDIDTSPEGKHEPVLIVFSDKEDENLHKNKEEQKKKKKIEENDLPNPSELWANDKDSEEKQQNEALYMQMHSNVIYDSAPRTRRNAKGNHCKRTSLYVEFKDIGWDSWILAPPGFEAYTCHGACSYPISSQLTPTKHAIIQTLFNLKSPQKASQACCVPTKLDPISLLYENENGNVIFQHKYEGMVVAECGCR
ncbi:bone morphogenetic protein 10 [Astyanax mexicanus]|uniref:bone morphogenetic protein 10 n=1 Tax=Astyanax mexicanus TaxID=7994 RepID=UPI0020CB033A|nr:bone morphogenetic protein 10 [Astyanax mexicanus]